jgi:predicted ATPase
LVGKKNSIYCLRRWSRANVGEGQLVLLSGEAGIGKSRLTAALRERLATELHTRLRCSNDFFETVLCRATEEFHSAVMLMLS